MSTGKFKVRVHLRGKTEENEGEVYIQSVWDEELTPLDVLIQGGRTTADWAREALDNWSHEDWCDALDVAQTANVEGLVLEAAISGRFSGYTGEWDEDIDFRTVMTQALPDDWIFDDDPIVIEDPNGRCELCGGFKHYGEHGDGACNVPDVQL